MIKMNKNNKIIIGILVIILMSIIAFAVYSLIEKSVMDRVDFDFEVNDNNSTETENHEKNEEPFSYEELSNMALEYFYKEGSNLLSKKEYSVGVSEDVIPKYQNQDMVVIEIRHINGSINTLDARYFINIYTAKGFDMDENEIDLND